MENKKTNVIEKVINAFSENTKGLLKSSQGLKRESLYKDELFNDLQEKEKKSLRRKLRNMVFSLSKSIVSETNSEKKEKLINAFNELYFATYKTNDYSLSSVCNENLNAEKKEILSKTLEIVKPQEEKEKEKSKKK